MKIRNIFFIITLIWHCPGLTACESKVSILLLNNRGGVYASQRVTLMSRADGKSYSVISDAKGTAVFSVPCATEFTVSVDNYAGDYRLRSPESGGSSVQTLSYSPDMIDKARKFAMSPAERSELDLMMAGLPDTSRTSDIMTQVKSRPVFYVRMRIRISDPDGKPLKGEKIILSGLKRNKNFTAVTGESGIAFLYLPKGDTYRLHFVMDKNYFEEECEYSKGMTEQDIELTYIGTAEKLRRIRAEEARIRAEEKRLKEEKAAFTAWCKRLRITEEEGMRRKLSENVSTADTVVEAVLNRNRWKDKLIVCDLTGSMSPYASQLSLWYQLRWRTEKKMQFVFFNDGDEKNDASKIIGKTGGIYYSAHASPDSISRLMARVSARGSGGDCPENNMEALIKGCSMAAPYGELIMIADNHAPVKDIELLAGFSRPVHIILCGTMHSPVLTDYLDIARKTGGSVHTLEEDIVNLSRLSEGGEVIIGGKRYRIMGGKFTAISRT